MWTIFNQTYDLSEFDNHPGGKFIINICKYQDCSAIISSYHTNIKHHMKILEKYKIDNKTIKKKENFFYYNDLFYNTLKKNVFHVLKKKNIFSTNLVKLLKFR